MALKGSCLCGSVRFESDGQPQIVGNCYCIDCRKSSGTGHSTHVAVAADGFRLDGTVQGYSHPADSGHIITRHFCPNCGNAIYSTNDAMEAHVFLRASALDDPDEVTPMMSVYVSRAPHWDRVDEAMPAFPEMPPAMPI